MYKFRIILTFQHLSHQVLSKVCSKYNEQKNKCKKEITELLTALCNNRQVELEILQGVNCIVGLEQGALIIIIRNIFSR